MSGQIVYLKFLGFPQAHQGQDGDSRVDPGRYYSGADPQTYQWEPGEIRALQSQSKLDRNSGQTVVIFDAQITAGRLLSDFGPDAAAWSGRSGFGFRTSTATAYKKAQG